MNPATTSRRGWIKQFVLGAAASLTHPFWSGSVLAAGTPGPGILRLKPSQFPALASIGGSVQVEFSSSIDVKPLTINRVSADRFVTIDPRCTHQGCTVGRYVTVEPGPPPLTVNRMRCPCHGSRYDIEGRVFRDAQGNSTEPAPRDLDQYLTAYDPVTDLISITIFTLALSVDAISVHQSGPGEILRLKLNFPATAYCTYEISHSADLDGPYLPIKFSLTPDGEAVQSFFVTETDGNFSGYVDSEGPRGFFVVGLKLTELM